MIKKSSPEPRDVSRCLIAKSNEPRLQRPAQRRNAVQTPTAEADCAFGVASLLANVQSCAARNRISRLAKPSFATSCQLPIARRAVPHSSRKLVAPRRRRHPPKKMAAEAPIAAQPLEGDATLAHTTFTPIQEQRPSPASEDQGCANNCLISTALAGILCSKRCDVGRVVADFAFFPPDPPTYSVPTEEDDIARIDFNYRELDCDPAYASLRRTDGVAGRCSGRLLTTKRGSRTPCFYFARPGADACLLYLHANATDCGAMLPTYAAFSRRLDVHVLAGEYSGYGPATKSATPRNVEADAEALYDEAIRLGFAADQLILYGQSVGSGPACYLAARRECRGVVLHSPIASGIRALVAPGCCSPVYVYGCLDPFNNAREAKRIKAPVYVVHGTRDDEVPIEHGKMIVANAQQAHEPFWVAGAGHNDLLEVAGDAFFVRLKAFLLAVSRKDDFAVGARQRRRITGLTARPELNGSVVDIVTVESAQRVRVRLEDGTEVAVKRENLEDVAGGS
jgi:pimeloyl-ACP methyl ester carboxylesterase